MSKKTKDKEKPSGVKAEIWSLIICEGVMDMVHGGGRRISELYVPTAGIVINSVDRKVSCFRENGDRYKKSDKFTTNNSHPVKEGHTYVPYNIYHGAMAILEASDVLKTKVDEIAELCKVKRSEKSLKKREK